MERSEESHTPRPVLDDESAPGNLDADSFSHHASTTGDDANALVLDPKTSERQYWRDIRTKIEREVWRPGDGDGEKSADYYDKLDPPKNVQDRWKFYQLSLGPIKHEHNEPPKYVFLDDRACHELLESNIPRASLGKFWPHDFGISGKIRDRRPHRGRGAVGDPDAEGNDQYDFTSIGQKNVRYYFTGEKEYTPIIYRSEELSAEIAKKLEKKRKGWSVRNTEGDPKLRGHNQFTPKELLVKHGAPSNSKSKKRKKTLADYRLEDWMLDKSKLPNESAGSQTSACTAGDETFTTGPTAQHLDPGDDMSGTAETEAKRRKIEGDGGPSSSPDQVFPFHRQTVDQHTISFSNYNPFASIAQGAHQESTCPYTESRAYASQLEKDLAKAADTISEQKKKIAELEKENTRKQGLVEELQREVQDLRWSIAR